MITLWEDTRSRTEGRGRFTAITSHSRDDSNSFRSSGIHILQFRRKNSPPASIPQDRFRENKFHCGIDSWEGGREDPRTKLIPALKNNILWDMADLIPYLVPTQFQESIFPPMTRPKIPVQITGRNCLDP
jgi:hypothetical protein